MGSSKLQASESKVEKVLVYYLRIFYFASFKLTLEMNGSVSVSQPVLFSTIVIESGLEHHPG